MYSQAILIKKWMLTLLCLSLMACGGGKKFDPPESIKDTTPPNIVSSTPNEDTSDNFEIDDQVEIFFSELMDPDSLILEEGVKLYSGKKEQSSSIDLEERESLIALSVVPYSSTDLFTNKDIQIPATKLILKSNTGRFALNTDYTVAVDYPARDLVEDDPETAVDERNYVTVESLVKFTTEKGVWKKPLNVPSISIVKNSLDEETPLSNDENKFSPMVISNSIGDTFLFWKQEISPGVTQLWVSRYAVNDEEWVLINKNKNVCDNYVCSNSIQLSGENSTNVLDFNASINEKGQLAVVWSQSAIIGGVVSVWANLYDGDNWLGTTEISDTGFIRTSNADSPQIKIDKKGNVVSIWREFENANSRIKTNIFKIGDDFLMSKGQWVEAPSFLDNASQASSLSPKLEISKAGLAIAVWAQKDTDYYHIYSNHLRLNQKTDLEWGNPERIDFNNETGLGDSSLPMIAIDQNNDAIAVWLKHDGQRNNLWFNRFVGSWENADYVERDRLGDAAFPLIMFNQDNRALVSWTQENKSNNSKKLLVSFFDVNTSNAWEDQQEIATNSALLKPAASFDREGNAILIWQEGLVSGKVKTSYYSKLTNNWDIPETLSNTGNDVSIAPLLEDGRFLSVWESENNDKFNISSALYSD